MKLAFVLECLCHAFVSNGSNYPLCLNLSYHVIEYRQRIWYKLCAINSLQTRLHASFLRRFRTHCVLKECETEKEFVGILPFVNVFELKIPKLVCPLICKGSSIQFNSIQFNSIQFNSFQFNWTFFQQNILS